MKDEVVDRIDVMKKKAIDRLDDFKKKAEEYCNMTQVD
jgi:hypothetical protein